MTADIIILGGGLVGLTAANLLAKEGFSVILLERQKPVLEGILEETKFDSRCIAISRSSQRIFQSLGVWEAIKAVRVCPYYSMKVWDAYGFGEITFDAASLNEPDLGHIIENRVMIKALWEAASQNANITLKASVFPHSLQITADAIHLELEDKVKLSAKLILGADGAHSWLREKTGIKIAEKSYHQSALVANVRTELPHQFTAWQRFQPEGPLAFLPLSEPYTSSIVWSNSVERIKILLSLSEKAFLSELSHRLEYRLGHVLFSTKPVSFPLSSLHAKEYVRDRVALIGDAIHVIHPLAGQGVNLGLMDAQKLTEVLSQTAQKNQDIGHYLILRKFERARKGEITRMVNAMSLFKSGFDSQLSGVSFLRSVGLNFVNHTPFLKKKFIQLAMG